ncbi:MAG TPA: glycine cleavage system aminomethyltransferase GcvT [Planctomycetota bacterium]|nr:glycine cleavage system aminomethyltransferase GcvT [Planctomycetota bacterium]
MDHPTDCKRTALADEHVRLGAKMVPFGGWWMPIQYGPILDEVRRVRTRCGLFDLSHMGRVRITGKDRERFVDRVVTNHVAAMKPGDIRYSLLCHESGGTIDDLLVYKFEDAVYLVINASNSPKDLAHLRAQTRGFDVHIDDLTESWQMLALQGPESQAILSKLTSIPLASIGYYKHRGGGVLGIADAWVSRTGYTGEDGFEVYVPRAETLRVWRALLEAGEPHGLAPIGLGARDTLRLEAGMPLYGHELADDINPLEAGLAFAVKFADGKDFIGRRALERARDTACRQLVGLRAETKRVPRQGYNVHAPGGDAIGFVCSGTPSPTLGASIGTAYVACPHAEPGTRLEIDFRGTREPAVVVPLPFYKRPPRPPGSAGTAAP